jgi:hypothetical protein
MEPNAQRPGQFPLKAVVVGLVLIAVGLCSAAIGLQQKLAATGAALCSPILGGVAILFVAVVMWLARRSEA